MEQERERVSMRQETQGGIMNKPKQVIEGRVTNIDDVSKMKKSERSVASVWNALYNWPDYTQIWPLIYGPFISGAAAGVAGIISNYKFRSYMVLTATARASSFLACAGIPLASAAAAHYLFVSSDIVEQKTECPVCVQVRAVSLQLLCGCLYPNVMVPVANFSVLSRMKKSIRLPSISKDPMGLLKYLKQIMSTYKGPLLYSAIFQVFIASGITYLQQDAYYTSIAPYLSPDKFPEEQGL